MDPKGKYLETSHLGQACPWQALSVRYAARQIIHVAAIIMSKFSYNMNTTIHAVIIVMLYLCPQLLRSGSTHCQLKCINPKSVSLEELYGCYNPLSLEWKIGVLAKVLSTFSHCTETELQTLNETTPEDGDKDTNDAALEAVSDNTAGQSSVELSCHKLDLSHSTLEDGAEESSPLEEKGVCHPAGGSVVFFSYSTFIIELLSELLCTICLV